MLLIDVHAHLELYDDLDAVIARAKAAGLKKIVANGVNPQTNRKVLEFSKRYSDIIVPALGIYPQDALSKEVEAGHPFQVIDFDFDKEMEFIESSKPAALGEIGLDYKNGSNKKEQIERFERFIELGKKLDIPLIIHSRKAEQDVIDTLEQQKAKKVILHCFSGKFSLVKRAAALGYTFSIPANIVKSEQFQKLVLEVNISQLLTETDSPYLSPYNDKTNEPSFVIESLKKIAEIKKMDIEETSKNIFMNYQRLF